jgi:hypothetical protein
MAFAFTLTYGATTVDILSSTRAALDYIPSCVAVQDGNETVTEHFRLRIIAASESAAQTALRDLDTAFVQARTWQASKSGPRVFVNFTPDTLAAARSELVDGFVNIRGGTISQWKMSRYVILADVSITRRNWWEEAEAQISLTNDNGTDNTAGLQVYNNNDKTGASPTKKCNYFDVTAAKIGGSLPAGCRLELSNPAGAPSNIYLDVGRSAAALSGFYHWAETIYAGTMAMGSSGDATRTNSTYYSGTSAIAQDFLYTGMDISHFINDFLDSGLLRFYVAISSNVTRILKSTFSINEVTTDVISAQMSKYISLTANTFNVFDLGAVRFPPTFMGTVILSSSFGLTWYLSDLTGITLSVDYFSIARSDYHREYIFGAYPYWSGTNIFIDDNLDNNLVYSADSNHYFNDKKNCIGTPIKLTPGFNHRFYFNVAGGDSPLKAIACTTKLYYRPRRLTF